MMYTVLFATLIAVVSAHSFKQCGSIDQLHLTSVDLSPENPVPGKVMVAQMKGKSAVQITGGTVNLEVKAFGVKITSMKFDLCKDLNITCPQPAGPWSASLSYTIPSLAPAGFSVDADITMTDGTGAALDCISMKIKMGKKHAGFFGLPNPLERKELEFMFEAWRLEHGKTFVSATERIQRMDIFAANHWKIIKFNAKDEGWTMAHNEFSHLTEDEFRSTHFGFGQVPEKFNTDSIERAFTNTSNLKLPASVDWTEQGAVTAVKNQGSCGSCWSFSTTGSLEGAYAIKNKKLVSFSEQNLVDCDKVDQACNGGLMDNAFQFIEKNGGLCSEEDYPYTATGGTCNNKCTKVPGSNIIKYQDVAPTPEGLQAAVAQGPVSVAIQADQLPFQFYHSGVMTWYCGTKLDHGVLAVGYGTDNGKDFWKIKNSWGGSWGEKGYIRIQRNKNQKGGQCGILMQASFPVL